MADLAAFACVVDPKTFGRLVSVQLYTVSQFSLCGLERENWAGVPRSHCSIAARTAPSRSQLRLCAASTAVCERARLLPIDRPACYNCGLSRVVTPGNPYLPFPFFPALLFRFEWFAQICF
jgi:hypothetical protein